MRLASGRAPGHKNPASKKPSFMNSTTINRQGVARSTPLKPKMENLTGVGAVTALMTALMGLIKPMRVG